MKKKKRSPKTKLTALIGEVQTLTDQEKYMINRFQEKEDEYILSNGRVLDSIVLRPEDIERFKSRKR